MHVVNKKCSPVLVAAILQTIEHTISLHSTVHVTTQEQLIYTIRSQLLAALRQNLIVYPRCTKSHSQRPDYTRRWCPQRRRITPPQPVPMGLNKRRARTSRPPGGRVSWGSQAGSPQETPAARSDRRCAQPPPTAAPPTRTAGALSSKRTRDSLHRVGPLSDSLPRVKWPSPGSTNWASTQHPL